MPQTWHFSYTAAPLQLFALQTHLVMALLCLIHPLSLVWSITCSCICRESLEWFKTHSPVWLCHGRPTVLPHLSSHLFCEAMAMCRTGKGKRGFSIPPLSLQSSVSFCQLKLFPVPKVLSQVMVTNSVSLTHIERKCTLCALPACAGHHSFLWAMCSTAMNQVLSYSAGGTPKFCVVSTAVTPRTFNATGSILDVAQREQFQAVYSMDEKTLCTVVQARSLWKASEQDESQTTEIQ